MNPGDHEGDYRMYVEAKFQAVSDAANAHTEALNNLTATVEAMKEAAEQGRSKITNALIAALSTATVGLLIAFVTQLAQHH